MLRRQLASLGLACLVIGGFQPFYLRFLDPGALGLRRTVAGIVYRKTPGLEAFAAEVRARTRQGDRLAFWCPYREWGGGYKFSFMRAAYLLGGRYLLPLIDERNEFLAATLAEADYVAAWNGEPELPRGYTLVWKGESGSLWRKVW